MREGVGARYQKVKTVLVRMLYHCIQIACWEKARGLSCPNSAGRLMQSSTLRSAATAQAPSTRLTKVLGMSMQPKRTAVMGFRVSAVHGTSLMADGRVSVRLGSHHLSSPQLGWCLVPLQLLCLLHSGTGDRGLG
jgi:hypothetical protein